MVSKPNQTIIPLSPGTGISVPSTPSGPGGARQQPSKSSGLVLRLKMTRGFVFVFENDPSQVFGNGRRLLGPKQVSLAVYSFGVLSSFNGSGIIFKHIPRTIHVDDGRCGGDEVFSQKIKELHRLYPISLRFRKGGFVCVFTGIQLHQRSDKAIILSQKSEYVRKIKPISIDVKRRSTPDEPCYRSGTSGVTCINRQFLTRCCTKVNDTMMFSYLHTTYCMSRLPFLGYF